MVKISSARALWKEPKGFSLNRKEAEEYVFVHFLTPIKINNDFYDEKTFVLYAKNTVRCFSSPSVPLVHDWFHARGIRSLAEKYGIEFNTPYTLPHSSFITEAVSELEFESLGKKTGYESIINARTELLFAKISRALNESCDRASNVYYKEFTALRNEIMLTYNDSWSTEKMAAKVNLSASKFHELYKEIFGITPQKDLQSARIEHAKNLLMQNSCSVSETASAVGYGNVYHFIRQFKKMCNVTPGVYAKYVSNEEKDTE